MNEYKVTGTFLSKRFSCTVKAKNKSEAMRKIYRLLHINEPRLTSGKPHVHDVPPKGSESFGDWFTKNFGVSGG